MLFPTVTLQHPTNSVTVRITSCSHSCEIQLVHSLIVLENMTSVCSLCVFLILVFQKHVIAIYLLGVLRILDLQDK